MLEPLYHRFVIFSHILVMAGFFLIQSKAKSAAPAAPAICDSGGMVDLDPLDLLSNRTYHSHVFTDASRDHELLLDPHPFQQRYHPLTDRLVQPGQEGGLAYRYNYSFTFRFHQECIRITGRMIN